MDMVEECGNDQDDDKTRPFEWLTSPASLEPFVLKALQNGADAEELDVLGIGEEQGTTTAVGRTNKILHVGSGRSALGEYLALEPKFGAALVVNADNDLDALETMRRRWTRRRETARLENEQQQLADVATIQNSEKDHGEKHGAMIEMLFQAVEIGREPMEFPNGHFDLAVDKGTLDCALCNHHHGGGGSEQDACDDPSISSVADFLCEVYRLLRSNGGAYLLVTFHSVDFIRPMLLAPNLEWDVEAFVLERQTESLPSSHSHKLPHTSVDDNQPVEDPPKAAAPSASVTDTEEPSRTPWSSNGIFQPDESYERTVNVLICRRKATTGMIDEVPNLSEVARHVNAVMDEWFRHMNPMLTPAREESFRQQMPDIISLPRGYEVLFTESERAHYTYDLFLEDWEAYCNKRFGTNAPPRQDMTPDIAIQFLREMQ